MQKCALAKQYAILPNGISALKQVAGDCMFCLVQTAWMGREAFLIQRVCEPMDLYSVGCETLLIQLF